MVDIYKKKSTVEVKELLTLGQVIEETQKEFPGLVKNLLNNLILLGSSVVFAKPLFCAHGETLKVATTLADL